MSSSPPSKWRSDPLFGRYWLTELGEAAITETDQADGESDGES